jgi:hypothetical protein
VIAVNHMCVGGPTDGAPCGTDPDCGGGACKPFDEVVTCTCMDPDDCHVAFNADTGAHCNGDCEAETDECQLQVNGNEYSCGCGPLGCGPKGDLSACEPVPCDGGIACEPAEIALVNLCVGGPTPGEPCTSDAQCAGGTCTGVPLVLDCECTDACHVAWSPAHGAHCENTCTAGSLCELDEEDRTYTCECVEPSCEPDDVGAACEAAPCENMAEQCTPLEISVVGVCQGGTADGLLCESVADCPGGTCADELSIEDCGCLDPERCHIESMVDPMTGSPAAECVGTCECDPLTLPPQYYGSDGMPCTSDDLTPNLCQLFAEEDVRYCDCPGPQP